MLVSREITFLSLLSAFVLPHEALALMSFTGTRQNLLLLILVSAAGCSSAEIPFGYPGLSIAASCGSNGELLYTIGDEKFPGERYPHGAAAYQEFLSKVGARPLSCLSQSATTYRILRAGGLNPYETVFQVSKGAHETDAAIWARNGDTDEIVARGQSTLTLQEWSRIRLAIATMDFWNQPTKELPTPSPGQITDAGWLAVEGYSKGQYHVVIRPMSDERAAEIARIFSETLKYQLPKSP